MKDKSLFEKQITAVLKQDIGQQMPAGLLSKVLLAVEQRQEARVKRNLAAVVVSFVSVTLLTVLALSSARVQFDQSGLGRILSLLLSDYKTVLINWREYSMLLLESLPVISLILVLASLMGLLVLFKLFVRISRQTAILIHK